MSADPKHPHANLSAFELGVLLGESLPEASTIGAGELALTEAVRSLLEGVVVTDIDDDTRTRLARAVADIDRELRAATRPVLTRLVRHPDGRIENLLQAAAGRCNPRAFRMDFDDRSAPSDGEPVLGVEARGRVELDASAGGPPGRAHGGMAATILDEAIGVALVRSGRTGLTVRLEVDFRAGLPIGVPLEVRARCTRFEGRKTFATGEISADGVVVCEGQALFVSAKR